jgi:RPA family protein
VAGFSREVARRVFAEELKSCNYSFRESEDQSQYAPQYLLTPTGAKCNRVFMVGTLTEKDDIGGDTEYWRGRVVDPTGSILIYAGQYQPEAAQIMANMEAPAFVAVVGKPNLYQTEDGNIIISIRAEAIQRVNEATRNQWIMDTARRTHERLKALKNAGAVPVSSGFSTADKVSASSPFQDFQRAMEHYQTDVEQYRQMVIRALTSLRTELMQGSATEEAAHAVVAKPVATTEPPVDIKERAKSEGRKPKMKKGGSLAELAEQDDIETVEEVPIFKRPKSEDGADVRTGNP